MTVVTALAWKMLCSRRPVWIAVGMEGRGVRGGRVPALDVEGDEGGVRRDGLRVAID